MPLTVPHRLVAGRAAQTGERHRQALEELRRLGPGAPPVPDAAGLDQAFLESQFLERVGRWDPDRWRARMQPFGIRSVTPRPGEILVRVPPEFIPDVIRAVMPHWLAEDEDGWGYPEVSGIPGLRARYEEGRGVLHRPGFPGRVCVAAAPGLWRKALRVAADLAGLGGLIRLPWVTSPHGWHPCETAFDEAFPDDLPGGSRYLASGFPSRILRRLPGLCGRPRADWHDLWVNFRAGSAPDIQFEWLNGPAHAAALDRLLDPEFGPGAELALYDGQSEDDCRADAEGRIRVRAAGGAAGQIVLRRLVDPDSGDDADLPDLLGRDCAEREAAERAHGYRPYGGRLPLSARAAAGGPGIRIAGLPRRD